MSRRITRRKPSVDALAALYDALPAGGRKRYYRRWKVETPVLDAKRSRQVVQDDTRARRLEDRAEGIEFALRFNDLTRRQRKEMEQMARNLRLAARGMKKNAGR